MTVRHPRSARRKRRLAPSILGLTLLVGLAACGGGAPGRTGSGAAGPPDPSDALAKYATCMHNHGVDLPAGGDVGAAGGGSTADPRQDPDYKDAQKACQGFLQGVTFDDNTSPQTDTATMDALLRYARCMRDNGIDMPDPNNGGLVQQQGKATFDPNSQEFKDAHAKCQHLVADITVESGGGR